MDNLLHGSISMITNTSTPTTSAQHIYAEAPVFRNTLDLLKQSPTSEQLQKRRSSSRSIKRKKFDDELVESSLLKSSRPRPQSISFPVAPPASLASPGITPASAGTVNVSAFSESLAALSVPEKKKPRPTPKRSKKPKSTHSLNAKDTSRWKPADDLTLILNVTVVCDLESIYRGVKFSSKFSLREIQKRWYSLVYDDVVSKASRYAMKQLNSTVIAQVHSKVLLTKAEEKLIATVQSKVGDLEDFEKLLLANPTVFLPYRTARVLQNHWVLMKKYNILNYYNQQEYKDGITAQLQIPISDISDVSDSDDSDSSTNIGLPAFSSENAFVQKNLLSELKKVKNESKKYRVIVSQVTGISLPKYDSNVFAILRGRIVKYIIQSKEVTFGRKANGFEVDIDLSQEGPAYSISRKHGKIKMDNNADFYIVNEGRKSFYVDGKAIPTGSKYMLSHNSVFEISLMRFVFTINQDIINSLKAKIATGST